MAEPPPETEAAEDLLPPSPPVQSKRRRLVQGLGAGLVGIAAALFVGAWIADRSSWEIPAAMFGPLALCLGVTWIVVGRVSPISWLAAALGFVLSYAALSRLAEGYANC